MVAGLSGALVEQGHEVTVASPLYRGIRDVFKELQPCEKEFSIALGKNIFPVRWWSTKTDSGVRVLLLENNHFFDREGLYMKGGDGYWDNPERFMLLSKAAVKLSADFDIVHAHDWQTAFIPMLLKLESRKKMPRSVFTIHNLAYQGSCDGARYEISNLPAKYFRSEGPEFWGSLNYLKAGLHYADIITTVSPQYAKEILTPEFGEGMEDVLRSRENDLIGVLNGVDYRVWKTEGNPHLQADYSVKDLSGKSTCKKAVLNELGLDSFPRLPLFGIVSRLAAQKGIDLLADSIKQFLEARKLQLVILGEGDRHVVDRLTQLQGHFPELVTVRIGYDDGLAHRIEAGSDFFLMPSRFEPCGLNQMYSLRYGAIPVVHAVGGLIDTVRDNESVYGPPNGIIFSSLNPEKLEFAITSAIDIYSDTTLRNVYIKNGMKEDYSWLKSSIIFGDLYSMILMRQQDRCI